MPSLSLPPLSARLDLTIDGLADEAAWQQAAELSALTPWEPTNDVVPVGPTVLRLLADDRALYVYVEATDAEPAKVRSGLGRRDSRPDDTVAIVIDPSNDGRRAYAVACNVHGVQFDGLVLPQEGTDTAWDARWSCAGRRTPTGYALEYMVPWSALRMGGRVEEAGLFIQRVVPRNGHSYSWPSFPPNAEVMGHLGALTNVPALPRRAGVELRPELTYAWPASESGRLQVAGASAGLTARATTPGFGVSATFNPDFSQLESDAAQIDATQRYALFYEEKRPFFLEGQDWFDHPIASLVYTRTVNSPLYGVRAAGSAGPFGAAVLHALDTAPPPTLTQGQGWTEDDLAGHDALVSLSRARLGWAHGSVGLLGSDRTVLGTDLSNRVAGIDTRVDVGESGAFEAALMGSATTWAGDADVHLGHHARANLRWSGERLWANLRLDSVAPDFRAENGFVTTTDYHGGVLEGNYRFTPPSEVVTSVSAEPVDVAAWVYSDGRRRELYWDPSAWIVFSNGAFAKLDVHLAGEDLAGLWIPSEMVELEASTLLGSWFEGVVYGGVGRAPHYRATELALEHVRGPAQYGGAALKFQPVPAFAVSLEPAFAHLVTADGIERYLAWTGRAKAELFFSRTWWVRAIYDDERARAYDEATQVPVAERSWRAEALAAWEPSPGRGAYLGGAVGEEEALTFQVFAKVSWTFDL